MVSKDRPIRFSKLNLAAGNKPATPGVVGLLFWWHGRPAREIRRKMRVSVNRTLKAIELFPPLPSHSHLAFSQVKCANQVFGNRGIDILDSLRQWLCHSDVRQVSDLPIRGVFSLTGL